MNLAPDVLILTRTDDFHAFAVSNALRDRGVSAAVVETNRLAAVGGLAWSVGGEGPATLPDTGGRRVDVSAARVVWWRRFTGEHMVPDQVDSQARQFVAGECRASLLGLLATEANALYISDPEATRAASNPTPTA